MLGTEATAGASFNALNSNDNAALLCTMEPLVRAREQEARAHDTTKKSLRSHTKAPPKYG